MATLSYAEPSAAEGERQATRPEAALFDVCPMKEAGQVTMGASLSSTDIVKAHEALFPEGSVAVQLIALAPYGRFDPEVGLHCCCTFPELS